MFTNGSSLTVRFRPCKFKVTFSQSIKRTQKRDSMWGIVKVILVSKFRCLWVIIPKNPYISPISTMGTLLGVLPIVPWKMKGVKCKMHCKFFSISSFRGVVRVPNIFFSLKHVGLQNPTAFNWLPTGMSMVLSKWVITPIEVGCKSSK